MPLRPSDSDLLLRSACIVKVEREAEIILEGAVDFSGAEKKSLSAQRLSNKISRTLTWMPTRTESYRPLSYLADNRQQADDDVNNDGMRAVHLYITPTATTCLYMSTSSGTTYGTRASCTHLATTVLRGLQINRGRKSME